MEEKNRIPIIERLTVSSLDPKESPELKTLLESSEIVVSDVDYCLLDISEGHDQGVKNVKDVLGEEVGERFNQIFHLMVEGHRHTEDQDWEDRDEFNQIVTRMKELQKDIVPKYGLKYWSKGTMMLIASEDVGVKIRKYDLVKARDSYWQGRADGSKLYEDTLPFVNYLQRLGIQLHLMTSSYHILQFGEDLSLSYDPEESRKYKDQKMREHLGSQFHFHGLTVGDPVDKPDKHFFEIVIEDINKAEKMHLTKNKMQNVLFLGDSDRNDLEVPRKEYGCGTVLVTR